MTALERCEVAIGKRKRTPCTRIVWMPLNVNVGSFGSDERAIDWLTGADFGDDDRAERLVRLSIESRVVVRSAVDLTFCDAHGECVAVCFRIQPLSVVQLQSAHT